MGWANCGHDSRGRRIGYAHPATCDHPKCRAKIDRGLGNACGGMHGTGTLGGDRRIDWDSFEVACEGYFCDQHMTYPCLEHEDGTDLYTPRLCVACAAKLEREYRDDPDWREHWPSNSPPLAIAMEAREGTDPKGLDGEAATARAGTASPNLEGTTP